jgi:integrase
VPLSPAVLDVLAGVRRIGKAGLIFTTNGQTPVSGFDRAATRIRAAVADAAERERGEPVDIPHWTFHDLRRTAVTGMARLGFPVQVVEALVNHASGAVSGVAAVYNRHDYAPEKRAALDAWARYVLDLTGERKADNVVPLTGTGAA